MEKVTVGIVGKYSAALLVDNTPGIVGTESNVNDRGRTAYRKLGRSKVLEIDLTGRRPESLALHNVGTAGIELFNGSIVTGFVVSFDSKTHLTLIDRVGRNVEEALSVDGEVVKLGGNLFFARLELLGCFEHSHKVFPSVVGNLLRTDESVEGAVTVKRNYAVVHRGCNNVDTSCMVNRNSNRSVYGSLRKHLALGLGNDVYKITELVENNNTGVIGVGNKNLVIGNKNTAGRRKCIRYTELVGKRADHETEIVSLVKNYNLVLTGIRNVKVVEIINKYVLGRIETGKGCAVTVKELCVVTCITLVSDREGNGRAVNNRKRHICVGALCHKAEYVICIRRIRNNSRNSYCAEKDNECETYKKCA